MLLLLAACSTPAPPTTLPVALPTAENAEAITVSSFLVPVLGPDGDRDALLDDVCANGEESRYQRPFTVEIAPDGLAVTGERVLPLVDGRRTDRESLLVPALRDALQQRRETIEAVEAACPGELSTFRDRVLLVVDRSVPYDTVSAALYTAGQAALSELWFAVDDASPPGSRRLPDGSASVVAVRTEGDGPRMAVAGRRASLKGLGVDVGVDVDDWSPMKTVLASSPEAVTDGSVTLQAGPAVAFDRVVQALDVVEPFFAGLPRVTLGEDEAATPPRTSSASPRGIALPADGVVAAFTARVPKLGVEPSDASSDDPAGRWPVVSAPDAIEVGQPFPFVVQLVLERRQNLVGIGLGGDIEALGLGDVGLREGARTGEGALAIPIPEAGTEVDVVLSAPGFDASTLEQTITLPRSGDSTAARFVLTLREAPPDGAASVEAWLFYGGGASGFARIGRRLQVAGMPLVATGSTAVVPVPSPGEAQSADLVIVLLTDRRFGEDVAQVIVKTRGTDHVTSDLVDLPPGRGAWVRGRIEAAGLARGLKRVEPPADARAASLAGFGVEVWDKLVPAPVRDAICAARSSLDDFASIQIHTNETAIPWELARVRCGGEDPGEHLGIAYRLARWHVARGFDATLPSPPTELTVDELVAIAPSYAGATALPGQAAELRALSRWPSFRRVGGRFEDVAEVLREGPRGIVHFAGHGKVGTEQTPRYAIELEDGPLGLSAWRGLNPSHRAHPLVFFNACDVGRSDAVAGFVDGWAPAVLETGASGYLGGLWPLDDQGAAAFATRFYEELDRRLVETGRAPVTDVLRTVRREVHTREEPTFLAYAFYGDANLEIRR